MMAIVLAIGLIFADPPITIHNCVTDTECESLED